MEKTNAMRLLDKAGIKYETKEYEYDENDLSGLTVAKKIGLDPDMVFKTIAAVGDKTGVILMCVPASFEINLKKAAVASSNKKVEPLHVSDLLKTVGYIRGGCTPIGTKKKFPVFFDESILLFDKITISAGVRGCQLYLSSKELIEFTQATVCDIGQ